MADVVEQLKSRSSLLQEVVDKQRKLEGARDQILSQLKEMGLDSIEEAKEQAESLKQQLEEVTNASMETIASMDEIIRGA